MLTPIQGWIDWTYPLTATARPRTPHRCPVCGGTGNVSQPPWPPSEIVEWPSTTLVEWPTVTPVRQLYPCHACGGRGIVWSE